ncbi:hypothetical protein FRX31_011245 [Thalictrum thalictroides]|uniref:Uncharacterized protein n=1 Tax=Thalictrum thalictroides TaxID=46969 RepID=A0A7J6WQF3_THATH|nr:hypothetical protein FRX31_011245 [Thalictrum thalictroides]
MGWHLSNRCALCNCEEGDEHCPPVPRMLQDNGVMAKPDRKLRRSLLANTRTTKHRVSIAVVAQVQCNKVGTVPMGSDSLWCISNEVIFEDTKFSMEATTTRIKATL